MGRPLIYQLLPRLFGNVNETRKPDGSLAENGVGKFDDINDAALRSLREELHITHLWLTGVPAQATATDYASIGKPADNPSLLKGRAGSPYAIKDCGDVCPDYAIDPARRMEEFSALLGRAHRAGLGVLIDFVPNHVSRSHRSALVNFGDADERSRFFSPQNNFFWLQPDSPGVRSPGADARVSGNNAVTWSPTSNDWYETAKLNYGHDFTTGNRAYPHRDAPDVPIPDTWLKMDAVLAHWQALGVDGFRCDMAHMVPPEFWAWAIGRARARQPAIIFFAEAYDNDPMKVGAGNVMIDLIEAGFDAVYDDPAYKTLKRIYDGPAWANDLDAVLARQGTTIFQRSLRYAENHDEVRLAAKGHWGGNGMEVGRAVGGVLFGLSRGPVLLCSGQEVGEPADGAEGFGGDDGRTTIFDYWSMPELVKWVNGHRYDSARLSPRQKSLRGFYGRLLAACSEPAFRDGEFFPLNPSNIDNPAFGRIPGEPASGHWLYSFARVDRSGGQICLVVVNLHPREKFRDIRVTLSEELIAAIVSSGGIVSADGHALVFADCVSGMDPITVRIRADAAGVEVSVGELPPLTPAYFFANLSG